MKDKFLHQPSGVFGWRRWLCHFLHWRNAVLSNLNQNLDSLAGLWIRESTSSSPLPAEHNQSDLISKCTALLTSAHGLNMMRVENSDFSDFFQVKRMWIWKMMDHASKKVAWIDGLVYPNLIHILSYERNTNIITKHWDFCLLFN